MSEKKNMTGKENSFHMENFRRRSRYAAVFLVLILAFAAITVLNINSGNVNISIPEIFRILLRRTGEGKEYNIIWKIRLPRILMAAILGGALSLSGFLLQTFFENPIAGPFVLGISSGAKMVVALTMIFYLEWARNITSYTMIVAAFLGSLLSVGFILLMSRRIKNMAGLLVGGIMIGYICSAVTDFVVTFAEDSDIVNLHGWSQGSFSGMSWSNVAISAAVIGITFVITFLMAKPIGAYQLGEAYAQSMGVNIKVFRIALILCRHCRPVPRQTEPRHIASARRNPGNVPRRSRLLYDVRPDCAYGVCTAGAVHQYGHIDLWCAGRHFHDAAPEKGVREYE